MASKLSGRETREEVTGRAQSGSGSRRKGGVAWRGGEELVTGAAREDQREDQDPGKGPGAQAGRDL